MTSQKDIQSLIADIDSILQKADTRLPWSKPGDVTAQRRVLERVRSYLVSEQQQQQFAAALSKTPIPATSPQAEVVQHTAPALRQEINVLRAELLQPLQADLAALRNERENLVAEIRQLENTRQQIASLPQQQIITEFSQELINRCTESLTQLMAQMLASWEPHSVNTQSKPGELAPVTAHHNQLTSMLQPQERLEKLRQLQEQFDHMLLTLDANHRVIFEALQGNLHSYHASLSRELEKMHSLGVQGEMLFATLVNRLAQQSGGEASISPTSAQQPDSSSQLNQATASQTTAETLPSTVGATQQVPPNPLLGTQTPPPRQPATQAQSIVGSADTQGAIHDKSQSVQDSLPEALQAEDWEVIEGLDGENLGVETDKNDGLDTFIQLNLDEQAQPSPVEEFEAPHGLASPDRDSMLGQVDENLTSSPSSAQTGASEVAELNFNSNSDSRRKEIEDLYESLFGTESLSGTVKPDEVDFLVAPDASAPQQAPTDFQTPNDDQLILSDLVTPLSSQMEDVLFAGLADPANEPSQAGLPELSAQPLTSWEDLFKDSATQSSAEADLAGEAQAWLLAAESPSNRESTEDIKTIAALTDLFDEMVLSHDTPATEDNSTLVTAEQGLETPIANTDTPNQSEDLYIPASPDEDLLATDELNSTPEIEIHPDQTTLQQLQQDLYNYELFESQNFPRQDEQGLPGNSFESLLVAPPEQENQPNRRVLMPELLAEDYDEFIITDLPSDSTPQSLTTATTDLDLTIQEPDQSDTSEREIPKAAIEEISAPASTVAEPVELDFEPELFPSELDQENAINLSGTPPEELAIPRETNTLEDESLIMLWDEPADGTTEERISSPEMEFEMKSHAQEPLDAGQGSTIDLAATNNIQPSEPENSDRLHWALPNHSFEPTPDSVSDTIQAEHSPGEATPEASAIPPSLAEPTPNTVETPEELDMLGLSAPESKEVLSENQPSDSHEEIHRQDEANSYPDFTQPDVLHPEQPDNPKN